MDDRPALNKFGEVRRDLEDGVVLLNLEPKEPLPFEEDPSARRSRSWARRALLALIAVVLFGGFLAIRWARGSTRVDPDQPPVPPIVATSAGALGDALVPFPEPSLTAMVGDTVPIRVRALDAAGAGMADTLVTFELEEGGGTILLGETRTEETGLAASVFALPAFPGTSVVVARMGDTPGRTARITIEATPGLPTRMTMADGDDQTAAAGALLPTRLAVVVTDDRENPVAGVEVEFVVRSGGGVTAPSRARTDSLGQTSALWRLGTETGRQQLVARVAGLTDQIVFDANATRPLRSTPTPEPADAIETTPVTVQTTTFVIGGSYMCGLEGGRVRCRGGNDRGQASPDVNNRFTSLASGVSHVCGLASDGSAYCWGANEAGQLGDGTLADRREPTPVQTELRFSLLTAGATHTCGLAGGGVPACWGLNLSGQLGDGSRNDQRVPRTVGGGLTFHTLTAGWNHTCGLTASGNAFCWGLNTQGQLGDGGRLDRLVPTLVRGAVESLAAGSYHTCGISGGQVLCWGGNSSGQLGNGTTEDQPHPVEVEGLPGRATALAAGAVHTCALVAGGEAYCWGQNLQGQLGDGTNENRTRPVPVSGGLLFTEIEAGGAVTCGVATDGARYCWGLNGSGQLGDGTRISRSTPTRVGG